MRAWLVSVGVVSVLGQVVLLRELAVASFGVELVYALALGVWLLGGAVGAALPVRERLGRAAWLAVSLAIPLGVVAQRGARPLLDSVPGAYLPLGTQLGVAAVGLVPAAALLGALFPIAARGSGLPLRRAYAWECAGGAAGGIASTLLLWAGAPNWHAALLCSTTAAATALLPWSTRPRWALPAAGLLAVGCGWGAVSGADTTMTRWTHPALAATRDTPYGRVTAERRESLVTVFDNDALAFDTEGTEAEEFVALAAIARARPERVLVLGGSASGLVEQVLAHRIDTVDAVEQDEAWHALVVPLLPPSARRALSAPGVRVHFADPRRFVEESREQWDLVLVGASEPASAATNRLYTREFFQAAAARLTPGGVVALRLPTAENLWTPALVAQTSAVERALRAAFPDVVAVPSTRLVLLASNRPLDRDPQVLAERLRGRGLAARAAVPEYVRYLLENDRMAQAAATLAGARAEPNSDLRPVCWRQAALLWLEKVSPALAARAGSDSAARWAWAPFLLVALVLLGCRASPRARPLGLAGLAGFSGMLLETAVALHYQAHRGVLFLDLGLLLTLFLAGMAAGAALARPGRAWTAALLVALAASSAGLAAVIEGQVPLGLGGTGALLFLVGGLCGALFGSATDGAPAGAYAADLAGGCLAALAGSLLTLPLLGVGVSALALAPLGLAGLLLLPRSR